LEEPSNPALHQMVRFLSTLALALLEGKNYSLV